MSSEAIVILANRRLAERERTVGPVGQPESFLRAVMEGIRKDHAGRIATMPPGLAISDQVKWIENGPPAPGARIPSHEWSTPERMSEETWRAGMEQARAAFTTKERDGADV